MTIVFKAENANEDFLKIVKSAAKLANIKLKTQKKRECSSSTQKALKELDNGEYETFEDFNAYKKAMSAIQD